MHRYTDTLEGNFSTKILDQFSAPGTLQHALEVHRIEIGNNSGATARVGWGYSFPQFGIDFGDFTEAVGASVVIQDLTYDADVAGLQGNLINITYVDDGTAGAETVDVSGYSITVHMEDGVSTATQIKTAVDADVDAAALVTVTVSGTGSNAQTEQGPTFLIGGNSAYSSKKAQMAQDGSVAISTSLLIQGAEKFHSIQLEITASGSTITSQRYWNGTDFVEFTGTQYDAMSVSSTGRKFNIFIPPTDWVALEAGDSPVTEDGLRQGAYVWIIDLASSITISEIDLVKLVNRIEAVPDGNSLIDSYDGGKKLPGGAKIVPYVSTANPENSMIAEYSKAP